MVFDKGVLEQRNLRFILQPEQKVNILLVDDRPKNLLVLEAILDSLGQNLVKAKSGEQALKCVLNHDFAVILLNVKMPGMDGLETAKLIRERERSQHTPIIFLTAFSTSVSQMFKGYSLGAVDYLIKPIEPEILTSKVAVFVELFKKTAEVKQHVAQLATVNAELRESEQRFRSLSACSPIGLFLTNIEGRCTYTNSHYQAICGLTQEESLGSWLQSVHPEDREQVWADWFARTLKGQEYSDEFRLLTQEGNVRWVHLRSSPMLFDKGELIGYVSTLENITERKQAEEAIQRVNEVLKCRVQERTAKLREANEQLSREIAKRKRAEVEVEKSLCLLHTTLQSTASESQPGKGTQLNDIALLPDSQSIFPTCSPQLNKVFQFIEDNYHQPINLCNVAQAVGYSPTYLTNLVKRQTKRAIHGWIVERRMTEARSLLLKTDEPVNQIAAKVGYPDAGHFTRQFCQLYKMPPKVWRNTHCTQLSRCASNLQ
jgi:PAS domain S-box-containing protein